MRIINVLPGPRHYSYASTGFGGKTLASGASSAELPLEKVHGDILWKDINAGKIQIRLSEVDRDFLKRLLKEADRTIEVQKLPAKPKPQPKPKRKAKPKPVQDHNPPPPEPSAPVDDADVAAGKVSLAQLQKQNTAKGVPTIESGQRSSMQEIQAHLGGRV